MSLDIEKLVLNPDGTMAKLTISPIDMAGLPAPIKAGLDRRAAAVLASSPHPLFLPRLSPNLHLSFHMPGTISAHLKISRLQFCNRALVYKGSDDKMAWTPFITKGKTDDPEHPVVDLGKPIEWVVPNNMWLVFSLVFAYTPTMLANPSVCKGWTPNKGYLSLMLPDKPKEVYKPPLPNLFEDGSICFGNLNDALAPQESLLGSFRHAWTLFENAPWNNDLMPHARDLRHMIAFDAETGEQTKVPLVVGGLATPRAEIYQALVALHPCFKETSP